MSPRAFSGIKNDRGFTLTASLIGIALLGVAIVATTSLTKMMNDSQARFSSSIDSSALQEDLIRMTSSLVLCMERMGGVQKSLTGKEKHFSVRVSQDLLDGKETDLPSRHLSDVTLQVKKVTPITGGSPGYRTYAYEMALSATDQQNGVALKGRKIPVTFFLVDSSNRIVNCVSQFDLLGACHANQVLVSNGPGNMPSCRDWPTI